MSLIITQIPFFYIIRHKPSGKLYGGAKWGKDANPANFMIEGGYTTSSDTINDIVDKEGLDTFETVLIITEFGFGMSAYEYETVFLQTNNIAKDPNWLNGHNNDGYTGVSYNSEEFKSMMLSKYGVEHYTQSIQYKDGMDSLVDGITKTQLRVNKYLEYYYNLTNEEKSILVENKENTMLSRYGFAHSMQIEECVDKSKNTCRDKYGTEHYFQSAAFKEKYEATTMKKHGVAHINNLQSSRDALALTQIGRTVYNDGVREYRVKPGELPATNWIKGKLEINADKCRNATKGYNWYNDGDKSMLLSPSNILRESLIKGRLPKKVF